MNRVVRCLPLLSLLACSGGPTEDENPEDHACEVRGDAGTALAAVADPASAPALALGEVPATVTLVADATGYVAVEVSEEEPALLFAGTADVVTELWHDGMELTLPAASPNEACPDEIPEHFDLDLAPGTWNIGLGPAGVADVWLLLISAEGHAH